VKIEQNIPGLLFLTHSQTLGIKNIKANWWSSDARLSAEEKETQKSTKKIIL